MTSPIASPIASPPAPSPDERERPGAPERNRTAFAQFLPKDGGSEHEKQNLDDEKLRRERALAGIVLPSQIAQVDDRTKDAGPSPASATGASPNGGTPSGEGSSSLASSTTPADRTMLSSEGLSTTDSGGPNAAPGSLGGGLAPQNLVAEALSDAQGGKGPAPAAPKALGAAALAAQGSLGGAAPAAQRAAQVASAARAIDAMPQRAAPPADGSPSRPTSVGDAKASQSLQQNQSLSTNFADAIRKHAMAPHADSPAASSAKARSGSGAIDDPNTTAPIPGGTPSPDPMSVAASVGVAPEPSVKTMAGVSQVAPASPPNDAPAARLRDAFASVANQAVLRGDASGEMDIPELGRIAVRARSVDGAVDVDVAADRLDARSTLRLHAGAMTADLQGADLKVARLTIDSSHATTQHFDSKAGGGAFDSSRSTHPGDGSSQRQGRDSDDSPAEDGTDPPVPLPSGRVRIVL